MMLNDLGNVMNDIPLSDSRIISGRAKHQQGPAEHTHQQGNGCLVDSCQTFKGYAEIADTEDDDNSNC